MEAARRATPDDAAVLSHLGSALVAELRPQRGGDLWARRDARDDLVSLLDREDVAVVVGTVGEHPVGFAVCEVDVLRDGGRIGRITELYVEPAAREVAVGEAMVEELLAWCRGQGCEGVDAVALPGNRAAKNFFETHGFTARAIVMHRRA